MDYAVIKSGGKQYKVAEGETVRVEKLIGDVGGKVTLNEVALVSKEGKVYATPKELKKAKVTATILLQGRNRKVKVFKMKRRKGYRRTAGHRQSFTDLRIKEIDV